MKSLILSFALGGLLFTAPQAFSEDKSYHRDRGDKVERHHQRGDKFERRHERTDRHQDAKRRDFTDRRFDHRTRHNDNPPKRYDRHNSDRRNFRHDDRYGRRYHDGKRRYYDTRNYDTRNYRRHAPVRRHYHHYYPRTSDFLLGGLALGSLAYQLTFDHTGPNFDFWRDYDGNCYRVEYRRKGRVYVDVPRRFCRRW